MPKIWYVIVLVGNSQSQQLQCFALVIGRAFQGSHGFGPNFFCTLLQGIKIDFGIRNLVFGKECFPPGLFAIWFALFVHEEPSYTPHGTLWLANSFGINFVRIIP